MQPREISRLTIAAYGRMAEDYAQDTLSRDRSADYALLLRYLDRDRSLDVLDLGCGPGHDLAHFRRLGYRAVGIDGAAEFVAMAQRRSGCPVSQQDLLALELPPAQFDCIFASASLFHIPPDSLPRLLTTIAQALRPGGVLFTLNPRGQNQQGWVGDRFCAYLRLPIWRRYMRAAGLAYLAHEYRPLGVARRRQQWISAVWQKPATSQSSVDTFGLPANKGRADRSGRSRP